MNKQSLVNCLTASLLIFVSIMAFALPVTAQAQYSQYSQATQLTNSLQLRTDKIKAEIINIMGEMLNMIALGVEELTLNFNKHFNLLPEESETATSTATTTEATTTEEIAEEETAVEYNESEYIYVPTPTPEPEQPIICLPLSPSGEQTYTVSTKNVPTISQIKVDPFDIVFNSMQTITATVSDTNPITSVTGLASTDTRTSPFNLDLNSGTSTSGTWQGKWTLKDSVCSNFMLTITAASNSGTSKVDLTFR